MKDRHALLFAGVVLASVGQAFDGFAVGLIGFILMGFGLASTVVGDFNGE